MTQSLSPAWVDRLSEQRRSSEPGGFFEPPDTDAEEIKAALTVIPSDAYQVWFEVGSAIHRELGEAGWPLFEWWSSKSDKFDARQCRAKWDNVSAVTGYTAGTIFFYADEADAGWRYRYDAGLRTAIEACGPGTESDLRMMAELGQPKVDLQTKTSQPKVTKVKATVKLDTLLKSTVELQTKVFPPLRMIIPKYLPEGLSILAGRPKVGKSWLGLDVAIAVASGSKCMGEQCEQGDVLGLFLEDSDRRIQRRMTMMLGYSKEAWPERLTYATDWPRLDQGGLELMKEWINSKEKPRLLVVDVLQRVRRLTQSRDKAPQYEADYEALAQLQSLAGETMLAIMVLHHQRKMAADDMIDTISGTLGLGGAVDTIVILGKNDVGKYLYGRGRDLDEFHISVEQNENMRYRFLGEMVETASTERQQIVILMARHGAPMTIAEVAAGLGKEHEAVKMMLWRMHRDGELVRTATGVYALASESM
jgi:hypothetical protein